MKELLRKLFESAIAAVDPAECISQHLPPPCAGETLVLGAGKAVPQMLAGVLAHYAAPVSGVLVTAYGHRRNDIRVPDTIQMLEAAHPIPDRASVDAGRHILELADQSGMDDQVIALISGGASALMECPAPTISLRDLQEINRSLLSCGASIGEINCVRKQISMLKGGRLALAAAPAKVFLYAISDVPGDRIEDIGSGPCSPDNSSRDRALEILRRYEVEAPANIIRHLQRAEMRDSAAEAGKFAHVQQKVIACGKDALKAAAHTARQAGFRPVILDTNFDGPAAQLAAEHAEQVRHHVMQNGRVALISGGETTVRVNNPDGRGGRNSVYLLHLALALSGTKGVYALAADTDGIDGTERNAGVLIAPDSLSRAAKLGIAPDQLLEADCSFDFFAALDDLLVTGPTGTNVNDFRVILIDDA